MTYEINVAEVGPRFSELLERVRRGEHVAITREGVAVAVLVAPEALESRRVAAAIDSIRAIRARSRAPRLTFQELRETGRKR